ncbi:MULTISPECIES: PadR family transcriptional regulator [Allofournierella]|uniref:PadR family transcriptional regulator n=1 Tax=Allofournierella massiliensis TaxID=1650663 RepID=A0ABT7UPK9_9FIRM|nr:MULTISPECIES: PadR family transcriptional regulator [Fournierella]MDM8200833.1 PadR family transcriptional regulator [Fournierella massiliensis]OUN17614.1 PadR family transcriptional regulator [Gemmiger sp. An87]
MAFNNGAALMDALVLSTAAKEPTYGYRITQDVRRIMTVSESTLYPVLRRLQKEGYLETYDQAFAGRNRRYYRLTEAGARALEEYRAEWIEYKRQIDSMLLEGEDDQ